MPEPYPYVSSDPAKVSCSKSNGLSEREKLTDDIYGHANLKYRYGNRQLWCRGYSVDTVGRNEKKIAEYGRNQREGDKQYERLTMEKLMDPFTGEPVKKTNKKCPP